MTTTQQEQAWQSGLVPLDETAEWNFEDWPPLEGGTRWDHASVVLDHPERTITTTTTTRDKPSSLWEDANKDTTMRSIPSCY